MTQLCREGSSCPKHVIGMLAVCIWGLQPWMQLLMLMPVLGLVQVCSCRSCNTRCTFALRNALPSSQGYLPEWEVIQVTCLNFGLTVVGWPWLDSSHQSLSVTSYLRWTGKRKYNKRFMGWHKGGEITHQLLSWAKQAWLGEINLSPIKSEQSK